MKPDRLMSQMKLVVVVVRASILVMQPMVIGSLWLPVLVVVPNKTQMVKVGRPRQRVETTVAIPMPVVLVGQGVQQVPVLVVAVALMVLEQMVIPTQAAAVWSIPIHRMD